MQSKYLVGALLVLTGCTQTVDYKLSRETENIIANQILDVEAPVNNDGITRELQGDYAKHAAENYRDSIYAGKEGRNVQAEGKK